MLRLKRAIGKPITTAWAEFDKRKEICMSVKLDKLGAELEKARKKRTEWDNKVKELERRYREEENSEIHDMVHAANLTPDKLAELLRIFAEDVAPNPAVINSMNEEENDDESDN